MYSFYKLERIVYLFKKERHFQLLIGLPLPQTYIQHVRVPVLTAVTLGTLCPWDSLLDCVTQF